MLSRIAIIISSWGQDQIGIKLAINHVIRKVTKSVKKNIYVNRLESVFLAWKMKFTDESIMQRGDSKKLNFEGLEMQKWNKTMDRAQRADEKNEVSCLVFMSKMANFLYFLPMTAKY